MTSSAGQQVAVIGLACRFPGARNADEFWKNLCEGVESISFFTPDELRQSGIPADVFQNPNYVAAKAVLQDAEMFDFAFFGLTPREAELMDPQQRLFLECAWEALENAAYDFQHGEARVGVYGGAAVSTWLLAHVLSRPDLLATTNGLQLRLTNGNDFLTTQVSYRLNLKGPSITVQTACSTALTAVHLACQAVLAGECDMALAGGVSISFPVKNGYLFHEGGIWSPDGHCRPFDAASQGTVEGNGAGVVVLKRLDDALADHDWIHAVIKGSAVNNDGALKVGYTAPSLETQAQVVLEALSMAHTHPETIGYVEAHGSGTPLGDPIEVRALTNAFRDSTARKRFCYLGSVKSNIGHLDNAAGMASLIKVIQALKYGQVPATLHFHKANPQLELDESPFKVNVKLEDWPKTNGPRRAGVSSLGIGGTNVHMVLEEPPPMAPMSGDDRWNVLPISAASPTALSNAMSNLCSHLRADPHVPLADVAYSLAVGRRQLPYRQVVMARSVEEAAAQLDQRLGRNVQIAGDHPVIFLFPGLADHYPAMGAGLFHEEPEFRRRVSECARILKPLLNFDIQEVLFSAEAAVASMPAANAMQMMLGLIDPKPSGPLARTFVAHSAVFTIEYALAGVLAEWGVKPEAMLGYSLGEYVAACVAGVLSLENALRLVAVRAKLIESLPPGGMLAVPLAEKQVEDMLNDGLSISIVAGHALTVVGGSIEAIATLETMLAAKAVASRRLLTSHAIHSSMMEPIMEAFMREVERVERRPPDLPYLSNVTGDWITAKDVTDPYYWARHLRHRVRFDAGLGKLLHSPGRIFLEVGPGQSLSILARQHPAAGHARAIVPSMRDRYTDSDDCVHLLTAMEQLWVAGAKVDWAGHAARNPRQRVPLPTYPFEKQRCWIEPGHAFVSSTSPALPSKSASDTSNWFYVPAWREAPLVDLNLQPAPEDKHSWLIFQDDLGIGRQFAELLRTEQQHVVTVTMGVGFRRVQEWDFAIHPGNSSDFKLLLQDLKEHLPQLIVHLWSLTSGHNNIIGDWSQDRGFYSLLYLAQALGEHSAGTPVRMEVISNCLHDVTGEEEIQPEKAAVLGPARVIPQEFANIGCRNIDLGPIVPGSVANIAGLLKQELLFGKPDEWVAWRGSRRWTRIWSHVALPAPQQTPPRLRKNGVYLIAGGLEGSGLVVAEHLFRSTGARLVLTGTTSFPARKAWEQWLQSNDDSDDVSRRIRRLLALEVSGCQLLVAPVDLTSEIAMREVVQESLQRFSCIHGVIHALSAVGSGLIQLKSAEMAQAVLAPRITGTLLLERVTQDLPLDFFLLFSSLAALGGGLGQVDTSAASAFLDAFAHSRRRRGLAFTTVVNWGPLQWESWQLPSGPGAETLQAQIQSALESSGIDETAFTQVFDRILSAGFTQVAVCQEDLHLVLERTNAFTPSRLIESLEEVRQEGKHHRPDLQTAYQSPQNPVEEIVATVWAECFGLEKVGVHDNFFELAGNSLLAIQIVTKLRQALDLDLPMTALFESPTVAELARRAEDLRTQIRESGQAGAPAEHVETPPLAEHGRVSVENTRALESGRSIQPRKQKDQCPLSFDQERLWFIQQVDPASAAYNIYTAVRFRGPVNVPELTRALNEIVQRHEIMRTRFEAPQGTPVQVIVNHLQVNIPVIDLRTLPRTLREEEAEKLAAEEVARPFDLATLPLFRTILLQVDDEDFICPTVFHHIITDWIAFHVFDRELSEIYAAFLQGRPSPLPPLPIQYADFAVWQREWLSGGVLARQIEFWRNHLKDAPPLIELPTDRPRQPVQTANGFRQPLILSKVHSDFVRQAAHSNEATLFITLLAIFKVLLFRLTSHDRIVVGSPIANRNHAELQDLLGFFINHLVFCTAISGDLSFADFLRRVRDMAFQAYANQDLPFARLVDELGLERDLSRTPLTQVVFLFLNPQQQGEIRFSGLQILPYMIDSHSSKFDITFSLWDVPEGFSGWIEYNTDLFDRTTILRMGEQFRAIVGAVATGSSQPIGELPLLSGAERQQVLREWSGAAAGPYIRPSVIEQVEDHARLRGNSLAVSDHRSSLTFAELNTQANRLARRLVRAGVRREATVGVLLERSVEMVVAWLAIGKAGAAYISVSEGTPRARWETMLADANAAALISTRSLAQSYSGLVLWIEDLWIEERWMEENASEESVENLPAKLEPENLVYVNFTSGSVGKPKGVAIEHRGLSNLVEWHRQAYAIKPGYRASQIANVGFDAAAWEIWPYLASGATVVIAPENVRSSPAELLRWLESEKISHAFLPTPLAESALEETAEPWKEETSKKGHLKVLLTGGDRLKKRPQAELPFEFWNHYGPTESTVVGTRGKVERNRQDLPDIGVPIDGLRAYVLDRSGNPAAIGVIGELHLGGIGLARGYISSPAETAEKFIPDVFSGIQGARLYRTGDLVRWGHDGRLHYVGRHDQQIKLRGYRIELGEIENQLCELPGVKAAAVVLSTQAGRDYLAGYVVGDGLQPDLLREQLRGRLPEYMVPASLRVLEAVPFTANGKLDRAALARFESMPVSGRRMVAPRTPVETALAKVWAQVLRCNEVSVEDNFFQLGGDSILSIQIVSRARELGLWLTTRQMFEHQTIARLALVARPVDELTQELDSVTGPIQLMPAQLWFLEQDLAQAHHFNQAVLLETAPGFSFSGLFDVVAKIHKQHDALRMTFRRETNGWRAEIYPTLEPSLVMVDLGCLDGDARTHALETTAAALQRSLDLIGGPLFRIALFDYGPENRGRLMLVAHHLIVDGVSWRILLHDLEMGCRQTIQGNEVQLAPRTTPCWKWADHLRNYASPEWLREEFAWWRAMLPLQVAPLPVDNAEGENCAGSCDTVEIALSPEQTRVLLKHGGSSYGTHVVETLLSACMEAVARWSGTRWCLVDVEGQGREEIFPDLDVSRTVGWFTSIYPLAIDFSDARDSVDRLKLVKHWLRSVPNHGIGYGVLRYLAPQDLMQPWPEAQIVFNYLGRLDLVLQKDSIFQPASENCGATRSPAGRRKYLLEVDAAVIGDRLQVRWTYSRNLHRRATIELLVLCFSNALQNLLAVRVPDDRLPPSDFPFASLDKSPTIPGPAHSIEHELADARPIALPPIKSVAFCEEWPLSFAQEQIWSMEKLLPNTAFFNFSAVVRFQGELNHAALAASFAEIVRRHQVLRVTFAEVDGRPVQRVREVLFKVPIVDLSELPEEQREQEARRIAAWESRRPFDLQHECLLRVLNLRMGSDDCHICLTMHHIVSDGWSTGIVSRELMHLYSSFSRGLQPALPGLPVQYMDFAAWEREQVSLGTFKTQLEYWLEQVTPGLRPLDLPIDGERSELTLVVSRESFPIAPELRGALRDLGASHGVSLFITLLATFALTVAGISGQSEFLIASLVAGRNHLEVEHLVGLFVNTVLLRFRIPASGGFEEMLRHTREVAWAGLQRQDIPFELVVRALEEKQAIADRGGFCRLLFIMQNPGMGTLNLPGLQVSILEESANDRPGIYPTSFELIVNVAEIAGSLTITIIYKTELFTRERIHGFAQEWQTILQNMASGASE